MKTKQKSEAEKLYSKGIKNILKKTGGETHGKDEQTKTKIINRYSICNANHYFISVIFYRHRSRRFSPRNRWPGYGTLYCSNVFCVGSNLQKSIGMKTLIDFILLVIIYSMFEVAKTFFDWLTDDKYDF